jgi:hypothetical protein
LDCFDFFTASDPTHGFVDYVSKDEANRLGLLNVTSSGAFRMAADSKHVPSSKNGRKSIRLSSKQSFNSGLFIIDLAHMPAGCGTWPAFWLVGPSWPHHGEIDIIEGVNLQTAVQTTLHTNSGCSMASENPDDFTGSWGKGSNGKPCTNCDVNAAGQYNNQGCGVIGAADTYGAPFNAKQGGVFATEWTTAGIQV